MPLFHVWFATKRRKWLLQGDIVDAAKRSVREVAEEHSLGLLECEAVVDHVHLLLDLPDRLALSKAMNLLKGTSACRLFQQFPDLKQDANSGDFWQVGYGNKVVKPLAASQTRRYIRSQWSRLDQYER